MFATKGRLIATICIVGFLVAGLGMYGAFHPKKAEATHSSWTCIFKTHKSSGQRSYYSTQATGRKGTKTTNCSECSGQPAKKHKTKQVQPYSIVDEPFKHKPISGGSWSSCHTHQISKNPAGSSYWVTLPCGG